MRISFKHRLKRFLIKCNLSSIFLPVYEKLIYFSLYHRVKQKDIQKNLLNFFSQFIKPGNLCFDVGAYKGSVTDVFLKLGAKVIAVEPQPKCIEYLQKKFSREPKFKLIGKGLSDKKGELTLFICEEADDLSTFSRNWNKIFPGYKWNKKKTISVTTLDSLIQEFGIPFFCKIDVEGFELKVLKGLSQPIPYISFEFTEKMPDKTEACLSQLKSLGYKQFNFHFGRPKKLFSPTWVSAEELIEKIKLTKTTKDNTLGGDIYAKL